MAYAGRRRFVLLRALARRSRICKDSCATDANTPFFLVLSHVHVPEPPSYFSISRKSRSPSRCRLRSTRGSPAMHPHCTRTRQGPCFCLCNSSPSTHSSQLTLPSLTPHNRFTLTPSSTSRVGGVFRRLSRTIGYRATLQRAVLGDADQGPYNYNRLFN